MSTVEEVTKTVITKIHNVSILFIYNMKNKKIEDLIYFLQPKMQSLLNNLCLNKIQ